MKIRRWPCTEKLDPEMLLLYLFLTPRWSSLHLPPPVHQEHRTCLPVCHVRSQDSLPLSSPSLTSTVSSPVPSCTMRDEFQLPGKDHLQSVSLHPKHLTQDALGNILGGCSSRSLTSHLPSISTPPPSPLTFRNPPTPKVLVVHSMIC